MKSVALLLVFAVVAAYGVEYLTQPTVIQSALTEWSLTIDVNIGRTYTSHVNFTSRRYCYQGACSVPGPTVIVKPGDIIHWTINNQLGMDTGTHVLNTIHTPNTTNLHTHGLHISPNEDNVLSTVEGGEEYEYVYTIHASHAPGTHWYHGHFHGSSAYHMAGGMVGALIVAPYAGATVPAALTNIPDSIIVLTNHKFKQDLNGGGTGYTQDCRDDLPDFVGNRVSSIDELGNEAHSLVGTNATWSNPSDTAGMELYLTNGQWSPTLAFQANEQRILRFIHAAGNYQMKIVGPLAGPWCTMRVIAADGVYFTAISPMVRPVIIPAGGRMDVLLSGCSVGTFTLTALFDADLAHSQVILNLEVSAGGTATTALTDTHLGAITRPLYLADQRSLTVSNPNYWDVEFTQKSRLLNGMSCGYWMGSGPNCTNVRYNVEVPSLTSTTCQFGYFAGDRGGDGSATTVPTTTYPFVTKVGQTNEWRLLNDGVHQHPFHLHAHHFQIISFLDLDAPDHPDDYFVAGEWRDTVSALDGILTMRFTPRDFGGQTIIHCHHLRHEDMGMMTSIYICDDTTSTFGSPSCPKAALPYTYPNAYTIGATSCAGYSILDYAGATLSACVAYSTLGQDLGISFSLQKGGTYTIGVSTNGLHPVAISKVSGSSAAANLYSGASPNTGMTSTTFTITIPLAETASALYFVCTNHKFFGTITLTGGSSTTVSSSSTGVSSMSSSTSSVVMSSSSTATASTPYFTIGTATCDGYSVIDQQGSIISACPGTYSDGQNLNMGFTLVKGNTYTIAVSTKSVHPVAISKVAASSSTVNLYSGASPNTAMTSTTFTITIPSGETANALYFVCTNHKFYGTITLSSGTTTVSSSSTGTSMSSSTGMSTGTTVVASSSTGHISAASTLRAGAYCMTVLVALVALFFF